MKGNNKKQKQSAPRTYFFSLLDGRLEDALLIYSNMIDEPIQVDPALDEMTDRRVTFIPFPTQPPYAEGLAEIEEALLKQMGVVIRHRGGKVVAEPKDGPSKIKRLRQPSPKPLHDVVLHVPAEHVDQYAFSRWPGEQSRKRLADGTLELHLQVPNLNPVLTWLGGTLYEVRAVGPKQLTKMLVDVCRKIERNHREMRGLDADDDSFAE